jgi:cell division protein FtsW
MNFQPSELAKFAVLIYAADYMVRKMEVSASSAPCCPWGGGGGGRLLLAEPDMGAFMVIAVIAMGICSWAASTRACSSSSRPAGGAFALMIVSSRGGASVFAYLDPSARSTRWARATSSRTALIAIGRGESLAWAWAAA